MPAAAEGWRLAPRNAGGRSGQGGAVFEWQARGRGEATDADRGDTVSHHTRRHLGPGNRASSLSRRIGRILASTTSLERQGGRRGLSAGLGVARRAETHRQFAALGRHANTAESRRTAAGGGRRVSCHQEKTTGYRRCQIYARCRPCLAQREALRILRLQQRSRKHTDGRGACESQQRWRQELGATRGHGCGRG